MAEPEIKTPWYESNLFWGPVSLVAGIILTVVAAMTHDLRWLLLFAWGCFGVTAWSLAKRTASTRIVFVLSMLLVGTCLLLLSDWLKPPLSPEAVQPVVRPYAIIEEIPLSSLPESLTNHVPREFLEESANHKAYIVGKSSNGEVLFYGYRNIGDVPAREIKQIQRATIIDEGKETDIVIPRPTSTDDILYKDQSAIFSAHFPADTVYTSQDHPSGIVRVILVMTYQGESTDPNTYFFRVVLRFHRTQKLKLSAEMTIESRQDGIVKNLDDLLR